ncbi:unnamed protein product [Brachionus calyciflorus]|uniref:Uncharacterized protein n=1 Tax=Brachionus calyciflorus TaxID=104777 RepID=A0A813M660_9BILA|nr:unnamed protein product [Brachionus calyciflorus]
MTIDVKPYVTYIQIIKPEETPITFYDFCQYQKALNSDDKWNLAIYLVERVKGTFSLFTLNKNTNYYDGTSQFYVSTIENFLKSISCKEIFKQGDALTSQEYLKISRENFCSKFVLFSPTPTESVSYENKHPNDCQFYLHDCNYGINSPSTSFITFLPPGTDCFLDNKPGKCLADKCVIDQDIFSKYIFKNETNILRTEISETTSNLMIYSTLEDEKKWTTFSYDISKTDDVENSSKYSTLITSLSTTETYSEESTPAFVITEPIMTHDSTTEPVMNQESTNIDLMSAKVSFESSSSILSTESNIENTIEKTKIKINSSSTQIQPSSTKEILTKTSSISKAFRSTSKEAVSQSIPKNSKFELWYIILPSVLVVIIIIISSIITSYFGIFRGRGRRRVANRIRLF